MSCGEDKLCLCDMCLNGGIPMMRTFAIFACALALAMPASFEAQAGRKLCKGTSVLTGKTTKFVCSATAKCCYDGLMGKGTCGKGGVCL